MSHSIPVEPIPERINAERPADPPISPKAERVAGGWNPYDVWKKRIHEPLQSAPKRPHDKI